ncbi:MAG: ATP-binding protein [Bacteroides sp.]|nr:ATP-binding protein [Bacteroides sp.]
MEIPDLSRINLISGKNNVGKSSLLEAIGLYINDSELFYIVEERGELPQYSNRETKKYLKHNIEAISSLFTDRNTDVTEDNIIEISDNDDILSLRYVYYTEQETEEDGNIVRKAIVFDSGDDFATEDAHLALEIVRKGKNKAIVPLEHRLDAIRLRLGRTKKADIESVIRVNPEVFGNLYIGRLWDNVALTEKEEYVIQALKIIEPNVESLAFLEESSRAGRYPVVKVNGVSKRLPLRSMGDGINHILSIILALVNCENGCLLIDEIDNGLHYTVQKQLWSIIFKLAIKLNVQIFATTHSSDCISSFGYALKEETNVAEGRYIRLEKKQGSIAYTEYNVEELKIVAAQNIEIR